MLPQCYLCTTAIGASVKMPYQADCKIPRLLLTCGYLQCGYLSLPVVTCTGTYLLGC